MHPAELAGRADVIGETLDNKLALDRRKHLGIFREVLDHEGRSEGHNEGEETLPEEDVAESRSESAEHWQSRARATTYAQPGSPPTPSA